MSAHPLERAVQAVLDSQREGYVALLNAYLALLAENAELRAEIGRHADDGGKTARGGRSKEQE